MTDEPLRATISLRGVVFRPDERVLILKRATDGGWELPGGRIDEGESVEVGVCREITEETGLDVTVDEPVYSLTWRNDDGHGRFAVYYRCEATEYDVSVSPEHDEFTWARLPAARNRLSDPQGTAVDRAWDGHEP